MAAGANSTIALLRSAADAGGAESRDAMLETATGAERHALRWALRGAGEGPLSARKRCRQAAATLFAAR